MEKWIQIDAEIKKGGQGSIKKVQNRVTSLIGAYKEIHPQLKKNRTKRERMCREISSLQIIEGLGVPKIYEHNAGDIDDTNKSIYFICEWIEGKTLQDIFLNHPSSIDNSIKITRELAVIVDRCHKVGVLHRDIKPNNIIFSNDQKTYLVDFGLAWVEHDESNVKIFNSLPHEEMSNFFLRLPELITGFEKHTQVSDITYLVGIFFFLLTGQFPKSLTDGNGNPPHITLDKSLPVDIKSDFRWNKIKRLFDVGFNPSIKHRFQNVTDLIGFLDQIMELENEQIGLLENDPIYLKLEEELNSQALLMKEKLLGDIERINNELRTQLNNIGKKIKLQGSTANEKNSQYVGFNLHFRNPMHSDVVVFMNHRLELADELGTKVKASFQIEKNKRIYYFEGYSSDLDGIKKNLSEKADELYLFVLNEYHRKTKNNR